MNYQTKNDIRNYLKTIEAFEGKYNLMCKYSLPNRYDPKNCVPSYNNAVNNAFKKAMKSMYKDYSGKNMYYKKQLLRAALGLTGIENSPNVWDI